MPKFNELKQSMILLMNKNIVQNLESIVLYSKILNMYLA